MMRAFIMLDISIEIFALNIRRCYCHIHHGGCIHWNLDPIPSPLRIRIFVTANGLMGNDGVVAN